MESTPSILSSEAVKNILTTRSEEVDQYLATSLQTQVPHLQAAMRYSLSAGGKRLRPILCISTGLLFGLKQEHIMPFAAALEYIHTYSLIHDDLPAMDDDDMRRGKASCHKAFDEATAILAGDGLLTDAFSLMANVGTQSGIPATAILKAIKEVAGAAGSLGMVGGQALDMEYTNKPPEMQPIQNELLYMYTLKTGALFHASCVSGALLGNASAFELEAIQDYAINIGKAFQVIDDILDTTQDSATLGKPAGSDASMKKQTILSYMPLKEARSFASTLTSQAQEALGSFDHPEAAFLRGLASQLMHRIT